MIVLKVCSRCAGSFLGHETDRMCPRCREQSRVARCVVSSVVERRDVAPQARVRSSHDTPGDFATSPS